MCFLDTNGSLSINKQRPRRKNSPFGRIGAAGGDWEVGGGRRWSSGGARLVGCNREVVEESAITVVAAVVCTALGVDRHKAPDTGPR